MRGSLLICAAIVAAVPAVALADDPNDPAMRTAAARARDRELTRQLNLQEIERVRQRDARYARGSRAARNNAHSRAYQDDMANYARDRAQYEREMAQWRRAVASCRAGDYSACDN
jgi:hypothetical protein